MLKESLQKIGLDEKAAEIYLTVLKNGPSSLRKVSELSGINRGTAYNILKELVLRGLLEQFDKEKKQHFVASNPEKLLKDLEQREEELASSKLAVKKLLPELKSLYDDAGGKPKAQYFEGKKGVKKILQDLLVTLSSLPVSERSYQVYSTDEVKSFLYECYPEFTDKRIKGEIEVEVISLSPGGKLCGLDKRKWVKSNLAPCPTYILLYADKVALITKAMPRRSGATVAGNEVMTVLIDSPEITETQKVIFSALWNKL